MVKSSDTLNDLQEFHWLKNKISELEGKLKAEESLSISAISELEKKLKSEKVRADREVSELEKKLKTEKRRTIYERCMRGKRSDASLRYDKAKLLIKLRANNDISWSLKEIAKYCALGVRRIRVIVSESK